MTARRPGGRPTAAAAVLLETTMLDAATAGFLADGYAATSIEAIARAAGVAKRTLYARWNGKSALFGAVLQRLMAKWLSHAGDWGEDDTLETALEVAASRMLAVALTPEAIALHRLMIAESGRFPELPRMMREAGAGEGTRRIAALLDRAVAQAVLPQQDTVFAAEQFLHLVLAGPLQRALSLGPALGSAQVEAWGKAAIALFLSGVRHGRLSRQPD